jgi:hypothetical protein
MNCDSFTPDDPSTNSTKGTYVYRYRTVATGESSLRLDHLYPSGPEPVARRRTQFIGEFKLIVRVTEAYGAPALDEQAAKQTAQGWVSDLLAGRVDQVLGASVTPFCWDKRELVSTSEELKRKLAAVVRVKSVRNIPIREVVVLKDKSAVEVAERFKLLDTAGLTFVAVYVERDRGDTEGIAVAIKPGAQPRVVGFSD